MNKEEILAKSRQENKDKDLVELEASRKGGELGAVAAFILCEILFLAEIFICGTQNYGLWSIVTTAIAGAALYKGTKLKNRNQLIYGSIWALISVAAIITAIITLFKTSTIL